MTTAATESSFIPPDFDPSDFTSIEPLLDELRERRSDSPEALRRWVMDLAALLERIDEYGSRRMIDAACHTDDPAIEEAYLRFVREVEPKLRPALFALQQRYLRHPARHDMYEAGFAQMELDWQADVDIFREPNVPLLTKQTERANDYGKIMGAMEVEFRGETYTPQQLARFLEETDRETRREAWEAGTARRLADREKLDALYDELIALRHEIATNAGFDDYRGYTWLAKKRFNYTPDDCLAFGDAVETVCVPLAVELDERRKRELGVDPLRPWDMAMDLKGRPPLRPFDADDIDGFVEGVRRVFERISPALAEQFISLSEHGDLDLGSRKGKRPGGFQASLEHSRRPFIFMNAAGLRRDVETLIHEGGHAFHYLAGRDEPNLFVRHAPIEFCEVASMSMELLACDALDIFYEDEADAARAKRALLEGVARKLTWIATIDGFQHWVYTHPNHTHEQRTDAWLGLLERFTPGVVDYAGHEDARRAMWQRQGHLYQAPFYYIEYGIAQLGALQVWRNYREDPEAALRQLLDAFALGGTRPLPELFTAAGIRFDFSEATLRPLIADLGEELAKLPE